MTERLAIIDGVRTPMGKAGGSLCQISADDLGAFALRELMYRLPFGYNDIDEVIMGNVAMPANAANIARVCALKAGFPYSTPAYTVHRNCASGMEAISSAANKILSGKASIIVAGGTESMSNIPLLFGKKMTRFFSDLQKAKTRLQKIAILRTFRPRFLSPVVGIMEGLTDPICGLIMGLTAENLAKEFYIGRTEQDQYALASHQKACAAIKKGLFEDEISPIPIPNSSIQVQDESPRENQTLASLQKLSPYFDRKNGTVTVGNACPLTDGAGAIAVMTESKAKEMGITPLGFIREYAYAGLEPSRMGLGPVYATAKLLHHTGLTLKDIHRIEINEAFSVQVLACLHAYRSSQFAQTYLGQSRALGEIDPSIVNVNGGAVALGHPVGMTGLRLVLTLAKELRRSGKEKGLATLCIGGGQGAAFLVEAI